MENIPHCMITFLNTSKILFKERPSHYVTVGDPDLLLKYFQIVSHTFIVKVLHTEVKTLLAFYHRDKTQNITCKYLFNLLACILTF